MTTSPSVESQDEDRKTGEQDSGNEANPSLADRQGQERQPTGLLPCPKCNDCWALQRFKTDINAVLSVLCGRCSFSAPIESWNTRHQPEGQSVEVWKVLSQCQTALRCLPEDALGRDSQGGWFYRDELLSNVEKVLAGIL
jgi:hypothetical protein